MHLAGVGGVGALAEGGVPLEAGAVAAADVAHAAVGGRAAAAAERDPWCGISRPYLVLQAELCAATTMEEVEALLEEFGGIRVVPLLQQILFVTPIVGS